MITPELYTQFQDNGFVLVRGVFSPEEVETFKAHYMAMNQQNGVVTDRGIHPDEPLAKYPRIMQPHRTDALSLSFLTDKRLDACMTALLGASPYAVQTMFYFKPAGSRGQALHQDQYYLRVQPGTCIAAWLAIDPCDEENGCLRVVPGTQNLPVLCTRDANPAESFTSDTVDLPEGMTPLPVVMNAGDVLFFNGQLVHGSYPNTSKDRFRRSLIGHYIVAEAEKVATWYHPVLRMDGSEVDLETSEFGGPCGIWVDEHGVPVARVTGIETRQKGLSASEANA